MTDDRDALERDNEFEERPPQADVVKSRILHEIKIAIERAKADTPANYSKASHYQYTKH